jgi:hypothetical protein
MDIVVAVILIVVISGTYFLIRRALRGRTG